ncbi:alpha/beta hydrolase [Sinomicrobium soli]|uniref:alpha/beta hydrolase n=1 Tax=Sinomicrobium sp. N-1-3-6 TaxID=2219864 RepID=UPI000DCDC8BA|nr:alpha/beta hydrolase family protein [Sinomicrobium sp. N-1-3-6]RAV30247.1 esterase family protein [Sinomicrobium sp. N-1-3-6]
MNTRTLLSVICCLVGMSSFSAEVDTVETYSTSMNKNIRAVVITPEGYDSLVSYPVVYLLHGYSGNYADWVNRVPALKKYADRYNMIITCPDGGYSSWYLDSPVKRGSRYETYVSKELVGYVDQHYSTIRDRKGRGITGLSMGGHGALYLAFRHQDTFGVAGSMSGGVDLKPFPGNWEISDYLGAQAQYPDRWTSNSVIDMIYLLNPGSLDIILACGTEDFFYDANVRLHEKLQYRNIPHTFISNPGGHTWEYWAGIVGYELEFMNVFFSKDNDGQSARKM